VRIDTVLETVADKTLCHYATWRMEEKKKEEPGRDGMGGGAGVCYRGEGGKEGRSYRSKIIFF